MKVSFLEPHLKLYGGIRRIIELSNGLIDMGHDVTIFHSDGSSCEWMTCKAKTKPALKMLEETHDVIIFNNLTWFEYSIAKYSVSKLKIYYVLDLFDKELLIEKNFLKLFMPKNIKMLLLKKCLNSDFLILSNATWEYEWLKKNMKVDSKLLIGGVNSEVFYPYNVRNNDDSINILMSGDPRPKKGSEIIKNAFNIVREKYHNVKLKHYHGRGISQEKMAEVYSMADIFVEGSYHAGWNNPVAEAMACKTPVVCTEIGGVEDFAFHEDTALLVQPGNPKDMASAIIRLIEDEKLKRKIIENAFGHIRSFTWEKSVNELNSIIHENMKSTNKTKGKPSRVVYFYIRAIGCLWDWITIVRRYFKTIIGISSF